MIYPETSLGWRQTKSPDNIAGAFLYKVISYYLATTILPVRTSVPLLRL